MSDDDFQTQTHLANSRTVVKATYSEPELPKFAGNPNIEALPLINTRQQALDGMQHLPDYDDRMRLLPSHLRTHLAMDVLHFFQPLSIHLKLEGMISRTIRDGYLHRNPLDTSHARDLKVRLRHFKESSTLVKQSAPSASGFTICGMSGVGKTTGLTRVLNLYPQVIIHTSYKRKRLTRFQLVWLLLECPKNGSTKGLCTKFFNTIDHVMGGDTNYVGTYGRRSRSTNEMMDSMANVAATHQLGVLVIDEIQYLNVAKSGGADEMLNFFVNLVNTIGLPVVIVGTYDAVPLLTSTFRQARRGSGQGDLVWDRMPFDDEWNLYAEALWGYQYTQKEYPITEALSRALHDVSYGIVDIANKIYLAAQVRAIDNGTEEITEGLLRSAYRDDFRLVSHIFEILKSGGSSLPHNIRDVCPPPILPVANSTMGFGEPARRQGIERAAQDAASDIGKEALQSSEPSGAATVTGKKQNDGQRANATSSDTLPCAPSHPGKKRSRKVKAVEVKFDEKDLRGIIALGQSSKPQIDAYHALLAAGYIKDSSEFMTKDS